MKSTLAIAAFAASVYAAPQPDMSRLRAVRRTTPELTDGDILNYALTLEHLENVFYKQGIENFTEAQFAAEGFDSSFYNNLKTIAFDEETHVSFLTAALEAAGVTPVQESTYAFGVTDVKTFVQTASILEGVGVSAYLGAAADIMSATYLTAAGSILTVESRHSAYIRDSLDQSPFPSPFDVPLSPNQVFTLAAPFIVSSPDDNPTLPLKPFPTLTLDPSSTDVKVGSTIKLLTPDSIVKPADGSSQIYAAFITVTGAVFAEATEVEGGFEVVVPQAEEGKAPVAGQSYVVLTGCNTVVTDDVVAAGPAVVEVSP